MTQDNTNIGTSASPRDELRTKLLSSHKAKIIPITIFGIDIELHQPSLGDMLNVKEQEDSSERVAGIVIQYAYVPGTDIQIFEEADKVQILKWPFGDDILILQKAVVELTGVDIQAAEKELNDNPSKG